MAPQVQHRDFATGRIGHGVRRQDSWDAQQQGRETLDKPRFHFMPPLRHPRPLARLGTESPIRPPRARHGITRIMAWPPRSPTSRVSPANAMLTCPAGVATVPKDPYLDAAPAGRHGSHIV